MPTEQKTSLGLNRWQGTDKPARADFVADNETLDSLLAEHFGDTQAHLSTEDRLLLGNAATVGTYNGNGAESRSITLPFAPTAVLVFQMDAPPIESHTGYYRVNFAIVTEEGGTQGASLSGTTLTVQQAQGTPAADSMANSLNQAGGGYGYLLFR